jgi:hypothetical protein
VEDHLKDIRRIADKVLFKDHSHEKDIIYKINQRVRQSTNQVKRKQHGIAQYLLNFSILTIIAVLLVIFTMNKWEFFDHENSTKNTSLASKISVNSYDPTTFKGLKYTAASLDYGLERARKVGITQDFQKTVTSNNVQFMVEDVYYDGATFVVAYRIKNQGTEKLREESFNPQDRRNVFEIKVNNIKPNGTYGGGMNTSEKKIAPNEYIGVFNIYLEKPEDNFIFNLSVTSLMGIKGEWNVNIPVSTKKIKDSIATFYPNYNTKFKDGEITVNKVLYTPSAIIFDIDLIKKSTFNKFMGSNTIQFSLLNPKPEADGGGGRQAIQLKDGRVMGESMVYFSPKDTIPKELTLRAYNSKDGSEVHRFTFPLQVWSGDSKKSKKGALKDNELVVHVGGKSLIIPAKIIKNVESVKKIKIPVEGIVRGIDNDAFLNGEASPTNMEKAKAFVYETALTKMKIKEDQMVGNTQHYLDKYKQKMKHSESNKSVPVSKVNLKKYPQLKGYDGMMKTKGTNITEYYLIKSFKKGGKKRIIEVKIQFPASDDESFLLKMISSLATAKFN